MAAHRTFDVKVPDHRGCVVSLLSVSALTKWKKKYAMSRGLFRSAREEELFGLGTSHTWEVLGILALTYIVAGALLIVIGKLLGLPGRGNVLSGVVLAASLLLGALMPASLLSWSRRKYAHRLIATFTEHRVCPSCGYDLMGLGAEGDGCTLCPECAAAWRLAGGGGIRGEATSCSSAAGRRCRSGSSALSRRHSRVDGPQIRRP